MMGTSLPHLDFVTTKTTSCLLLLTGRDLSAVKPTQCINCARCAAACPMNLMPMYIESCTLAEDYAGAKYYGANDCILCGCCSYACPAARPLVFSIQTAKKMIKLKKL
jgi:electron transport complex protein RnfC